MDFKGCYTALVTPFTPEGAVDERILRELVEFQIAQGIDGLVPCGTTGESPTLSHEEHKRVITLVVQYTAKRCRVMAGTGSNCTDEAIDLTRHAKAAGADAVLQVAPYYNKPTQAGLYAHFRAIAQAADLPMFIYNIPGRCAVDVANETLARLRRDLPRQVVGLKEATGNVERVSQIRELVDEGFTILSGDDVLTMPIMSLGGAGVISVASNLVPRELTAMVRLYREGRTAEAAALNRKYYNLCKALFFETNPVPVKTALALMGKINGTLRLPLVEMEPANLAKLKAVLKQYGLI